ncbi:MAG TPA: phage baseplate assembly protein V [Pyrinomonadaceae bacterium]|nr:phage baseplate assembly protein V [Pyrinomonadaceae bacterium]
MPFTLYDSSPKKDEKKSDRLETSILEGTVINNCNPKNQGKVLVRIPSLGQEIWARLSGPGAGPDSGLFHAYNPDSEVLIGFSNNSVASAFILSGLWNTRDSPPVKPGLKDVPTKRVMKTGLKEGFGHTLEFDDGIEQSVTILTSTKQKILLNKEKIEISTTGDTVKVILDLKTQTVSIDAPQIKVGSDKTLSLTLNAKSISIGSATTVSTTVQGKMVNIN